VLKKILNDVVLGDNPPLKVRENRIYGPYFLKRFEQCFGDKNKVIKLDSSKYLEGFGAKY